MTEVSKEETSVQRHPSSDMEMLFVLDLKSSALFEEVHRGYEGRTIATRKKDVATGEVSKASRG